MVPRSGTATLSSRAIYRRTLFGLNRHVRFRQGPDCLLRYARQVSISRGGSSDPDGQASLRLKSEPGDPAGLRNTLRLLSQISTRSCPPPVTACHAAPRVAHTFPGGIRDTLSPSPENNTGFGMQPGLGFRKGAVHH